MSVGIASFYLSNWTFSELIHTYEYLLKKSVHLFNPDDQRIHFIDEYGDTLLLSLSGLEERLSRNREINVKLWMPNHGYILWSIYRNPVSHCIWVQDFSFYAIDHEGSDFFTDIILVFFLSVNPEFILGFYIDQYDKTSCYDWNMFFAGRGIELDALPDILYLKKEEYDFSLFKSIDLRIFETKYGLALTDNKSNASIVARILGLITPDR
ncbi:hypothetical protein [Anthocerotibacter panamensis]|uniref:hypothetical protein n=1 Tax=Anthocerotibacter panamensis TaxID=2857077 RepID=UPI001C402151|nr:hypothetical protein [Anthocerotibacter panamensis]